MSVAFKRPPSGPSFEIRPLLAPKSASNDGGIVFSRGAIWAFDPDGQGFGVTNGRIAARTRLYERLQSAASDKTGVNRLDVASGSSPRRDPEAAWKRVLANVRGWGDLDPDWDGEGGVAPPEGVIRAAEEIAEELRFLKAPVPEDYVAGDGEIGFRWRSEDGYASLSLVADGNVLLYMHVGDRVLHDLDEPWHPGFDISAYAKDLPGIA